MEEGKEVEEEGGREVGGGGRWWRWKRGGREAGEREGRQERMEVEGGGGR